MYRERKRNADKGFILEICMQYRMVCRPETVFVVSLYCLLEIKGSPDPRGPPYSYTPVTLHPCQSNKGNFAA